MTARSISAGGQGPKYTVRTASRITGLKAATLRAWEKRYSAPAPSRTPSRYRLYSDDDLREIQWMKARVEEGIPPRQAARLAIERRAAGVSLDAASSLEAAALVADLKTHCLAYDEDGVLAVLRRAATVLRPVEIMRQVLLGAIAEIGRDWESGLVTVAQEHFASQLARRFGARLMDAYPQGVESRPAVLACAPGEHHELGLLAVAIEIRSRGIPAIYLGPDVPVESLASSAQSVGAGLAMISVTLPEHLEAVAAARSVVDRLERFTDSPVLWAGPAADRAPGLGLPGLVALTIDEAAALAVRRLRGAAGQR